MTYYNKMHPFEATMIFIFIVAIGGIVSLTLWWGYKQVAASDPIRDKQCTCSSY